MKKSIAVLGLLFVTGISFGQTENKSNVRQVTTLPNGIIVSETAGVEGFVTVTTEQKIETSQEPKPISTWTLDECQNTLYHLEQKMHSPGMSEERIAGYKKTKEEVLLRKQQLENQRK